MNQTTEDTHHHRLRLAGLALTLAALVGAEFMPARTLDLMAPGAVGGPYLINSTGTQDESSVRWVDAARQRKLRCEYDRPAPYLGCGVTYILSGNDPTIGRDLSRFDSVEIDLAYQGASPFVRLGIRNFDPRFSKASDLNSARFHSVNLRLRDLGRPMAVDLTELTVPEWWIHQFNLEREYNRAGLENAVALSVDLAMVQAGEVHELEVKRLVLKGQWVPREQIYLAIVAGWVLATSAMALRSWRRLRHSHNRQQREIDALTSRTRQLRVEQDKLRRLATIDELTGVLNRRGLEQALADYEDGARGMTLVMLDIDHFKRVNDRLGHDCGDEVLRRVAAVVAANLRASDVFGRLGGEEFVVACQGTRLRDAERLAEKLRVCVENSEIDSAGVRLNVTASFGVALAPPGGSAADALKRADAALYRAKEAGRNRVESDRAPHSDDAPTTV